MFDPLSLEINGTIMPYENKAKYLSYLSMTLDSKFRWKEHVKKIHLVWNINLLSSWKIFQTVIV